MSTYATPIPGVAQYEQLMALAQHQYNSSLALFNQERGQLLSQYGYQGDVDPATGLLTNLRVNAHDPYGLYQQMLRGGGQAAMAARENAAARNLRGGLAHQMVTEGKYQFGRASAALGSAFEGSLTGIQEKQNEAYFQNQMTQWQAQMQALLAALAAKNFNPANPGPSGPNGSPPAGQNPNPTPPTGLTPVAKPGQYYAV